MIGTSHQPPAASRQRDYDSLISLIKTDGVLMREEIAITDATGEDTGTTGGTDVALGAWWSG